MTLPWGLNKVCALECVQVINLAVTNGSFSSKLVGTRLGKYLKKNVFQILS